MDMKILTENGKVCHAIERNKMVFYLKEPVPMKLVGSVLEVLEQFEETFDLSTLKTKKRIKSEEWDEDTLREFMESRSDKQFGFFKSLAAVDEWRYSSEIKQDFKDFGLGEISSQTISGIRSGNTKAYRNRYGKEKLEEREWMNEAWENRYRIKPKYLEVVRQVIEDIEE